MMLYSKAVSILLTCLCLLSCATPSQVAKQSEADYANQTVSNILKCTSVDGINDRLSNIITLSTQNCFKRVNGILKMVWDDQFLRAYVDKKTKKIISVQIYSIIHNRSGAWANPRSVNFIINSDLLTADITNINSDVDCTNSDLYGSCLYREDVGFSTDYKIFEEAKSLESKGIRDFEYKIKTRIGDARRIFNVVEIIGLHQKIQDVISSIS